MKTLSLKISLLALLSLVLFSCSPEEDGIYFDESNQISEIDTIEYSAIESEILDLVNAHRLQLGLTALKPLSIVSVTADEHTNYMIKVGQLNHDNFQERSKTLMEKAKAKQVGENVAFGYSTAEGAVNGWLNSESHRALIENPNYTHFGISTEKCKNSGRNYFTQMFINK
jgi:uncharacterized protein YkwD